MLLTKIKLAVAAALAIGILGTGLGWRASVAAPAPPEAKVPDIKLPADPKAAVITFDHMGGGIRRVSNDPVMIIRADGTVTVSDPWGLGGAAESKLSAQELQNLLRFIIRDKEFFDFDQAKVQKQMDEEMRKGPAIAVRGAYTTIVRVQADGRDHEARYYALSTFGNHYAKVKALGQLRDVEARLQRVQMTAVAGGGAAVAADLKLANERLLKEHPRARPLTLDDLLQVTRQDGKTVVRFHHVTAKEPQKFASVTIERTAKDEPKVTVRVGEQGPPKLESNK
jgi:hypothetical protein